MSLNVKVEKKGHCLVYVTSYYPHKVFLKYEKKKENVKKKWELLDAGVRKISKIHCYEAIEI